MSLDVYLYGEQIGKLLPAGGDEYELAYSADRIQGFGEGGAVLSNALPGSEEPYSPGASRAYVEGLLPEGIRREKIAAELGLDQTDGYGLIAALGRDCPGAVTFVPEGESAQADDDSEAWLSRDELEELVATQPHRLLDPDREERMRFALPGTRHKLSLARGEAGGRWAWPAHGVPSTHIVKPEGDGHPELVANEMFCTTVAREAGLLVASTAVEMIAGQHCLVSERFDRATQGLETERFHQESFCQALGLEAGCGRAASPSFAESCGLLRATGEEQAITLLIAAAFCHYLLGNGDAHGANFGLLFAYEGPLLAPFYDIVSTAVYDDPLHIGLTIAASYSDRASMDDLATIAEECGIGIEHCRNVAGNMAERVSGALLPAVERAKDDGWDAPVIEGIIEIAAERSLALGEEIHS